MIQWEQGRYSSHQGTIDGITVASINYSAVRSDPKPWILRTEFVGFRGEKQFVTVDEAKAAAEKLRKAAIKFLGGTP